MDIKKRIQELSLDQKAKLYFMGLVRQGKIDTLPEDPKAAYVSMMMDKDDYSRSISGKDKRTFMEPEDSMPAARAKKMAGLDEMQMVNKETGEDITKYVLQLLQGEISKEEFEKITGLKKEARDEEDEENDRNLAVDDIPDSLREIATELGYLEEIGMFHDPLGYEPEDMDNPDEDKVDISYTDPGFRFYKMKVDGKRLNREEGTEYLKGLGIDMEIPRSYDESILDKIVAQLKEKGIDADHDAAFDPS